MWFFSEEQKIFKEAAFDFAKNCLTPGAFARDTQENCDRSIFKDLGLAGFLGVMIPPAYGGLGEGAITATLLMQALATEDAGIALSVLAHSILCAYQISKHGNFEQKQATLPKLVEGNWIGAMAMSEPSVGSDALGMQLRATPTGNTYTLHGSKTWITNAPIADIIYTYARTGPAKKDISIFLVPKKLPGLTIGKKFSKLGMRSSLTAEVFFDQCILPKDALIGKVHHATPSMMDNLNLERIVITGISLGIAQKAIQIASKYAKERKAFGKPIGAFQQIQERLASATAKFESCQAFTYHVAHMWDKNLMTPQKANLLSASVKLETAQIATHIALDAIQILGGYGYTQEFTVERLLRDAKLIEIGAGTNEILRLVIARELLGRAIVEI